MIVDQVLQFIRDPTSGEFEELAREAFAFQYEQIETYRRLCQRSEIAPKTVADWRQVPAIPALAFKSLDLAVGDGGEVFRSSGTTTERPSVHRHVFPDLYRATIDQTFPDAVLGDFPSIPILSLIPDRHQAPESSLAFMVDHVLRRWGAEDSLTAFGRSGVDPRRARSFLAARQRDKRPVLILATAFAMDQLLDALDRLGLRFRLPVGSVVFETGGYKGRSREVSQQSLLTRLQQSLAVPAERVVREYGMTELTSQFYTAVRHGGDPDLFLPPEWVRVRILDPESLAETAPGETGLIAVFDLANLSSAVHLLTEDLGRADGKGFRLIGRAAGAELRGCSLAVEELSRS